MKVLSSTLIYLCILFKEYYVRLVGYFRQFGK